MSKRFWAYLKIQMPFSILEISKPRSLVKTNHRDSIFLLNCSEFTSLFQNVNKTKLEIADLRSLFTFPLTFIIYVLPSAGLQLDKNTGLRVYGRGRGKVVWGWVLVSSRSETNPSLIIRHLKKYKTNKLIV